MFLVQLKKNNRMNIHIYAYIYIYIYIERERERERERNIMFITFSQQIISDKLILFVIIKAKK